jgi:hypothetical protein
MCTGLLIRTGGADENVLPGSAAKQFQVALDLRRRIRDPVDDGIKPPAAESLGNRGWVINVGVHRLRATDHFRRPSAGKQSQTDSALHRQTAAGAADDARPADKENFHAPFVTELLDNSQAGRIPENWELGIKNRKLILIILQGRRTRDNARWR